MNINEDSTIYNQESEAGIFVSSPKSITAAGKSVPSTNGVSGNATQSNIGSGQRSRGSLSKSESGREKPITHKSAPPVAISIQTIPSQTQLLPNDNNDGIPDISKISRVAPLKSNESDNISNNSAEQMIAGMTAADIAKLIELSQNAGQEYLYLVQINEDLTREKQQLLMRMEDMQTQFGQLQKAMVEDRKHRRQQSDLGMQMETFKSQIITLSTENEMLQETVTDLEIALNHAKDEVAKEQNKQMKMMEAVAKGGNINDLNNVADMDEDDHNGPQDVKLKGLLEQALQQLETARNEKNEYENALNETKRELLKVKKERNEHNEKAESLQKLVETQQSVE